MDRTDAVYDTDWEFYDDFYADVDDIDFYRALAERAGGPVLEVMCGTGRVLVPLARSGFEVVGMDSNEKMLEVARRKIAKESPEVQKRARLVRADARDFDLGSKFGVAILAFSSVNHLLSPDDQDRAMACIKRNLAEDGFLAVASFIPHNEKLGADKLDKEVELENGDLLIRYSTRTLNPAGTVMRLTYRWEKERRGKIVYEHSSSFELRLLRPNQLKALLEGAGFQLVERWGGYRGEPLDPKGDVVVFVARPRMVWKENAKLLAR
jgi:ubiquinone/menaquinone biosynthesis C-methylase UbiE